MHNGLMGVDIAALTSSLHFWEKTEYVSCGVVFVGVACETIAGIKSLIKNESHRVTIERIFAVVLCIGLLGELAGLIKSSRLTGQIIDAVNEKASAANADAAKLSLRAAELEKEAATFQKEAAVFQKQAEDEHLARVKLQSAIGPRNFTKADLRAITEACRPFAKPEIHIVIQATLGNAFHDGIFIMNALKDAGFTNVDLQELGLNWYELGMSGPKEYGEAEDAILSALMKHGHLMMAGVIEPKPPGDPIRIYIGERRMGALPK